MNTPGHISRLLSLILLLLLAGLLSKATAQTARVQLSQLDHLSSKASETVDINIDERLLQMASKLLSDPDDKDVKDVVSGLKGIYVKSYEFEHEGEFAESDYDSIRQQVSGPGWSRIVTVNSKKEGSVEVYLLTVGDAVSGLVLVSVEPKELTVVNIVGPVDLQKLAKLEGQFGIPDLGFEQPNKPKAKD
jgi:Domain of unknown function (DUF4252)